MIKALLIVLSLLACAPANARLHYHDLGAINVLFGQASVGLFGYPGVSDMGFPDEADLYAFDVVTIKPPKGTFISVALTTLYPSALHGTATHFPLTVDLLQWDGKKYVSIIGGPKTESSLLLAAPIMPVPPMPIFPHRNFELLVGLVPIFNPPPKPFIIGPGPEDPFSQLTYGGVLAVVPEPASALMLLGGLGCVVVLSRARKARTSFNSPTAAPRGFAVVGCTDAVALL